MFTEDFGSGLGAHRWVVHPRGGLASGDGIANLVTTDPESHLVFDFALTNTKVYALYERVRVPGSAYASFSYAVPVADRRVAQWHTCGIRVDRAGTRATWLLDGRTVLVIERLGYRCLDRAHLLLDHGGTEEPVRVRQLCCGMGIFTMLDGVGPEDRGLVRLNAGADFYRTPQRFVDEQGTPESRLWGAGAVMNVRAFTVLRSGLGRAARGMLTSANGRR